MQKKNRIPTPLLRAEEHPSVEIVAHQGPGRRRWLIVLGFLASALLTWGTYALFRPFGAKPADPREQAKRLRAFFQEMGGIWVKVGQLLAMRRDAFSDAFCDEMATLQDRARGFSSEEVRQIIEEDLEGPLNQFFAEFNLRPIAAASIGQTHEARLALSHVRVAVKVQRPNIAASFHSDLHYIRRLCSFFSRINFLPFMRWHEFLWEVEKTLQEELDYRQEATSIARMKKKLRRHGIYVPKVFARLCSARVLVMEFLDGVFMSDYIKVATTDPERLDGWLKENNIKPSKVGERLYMTHMRQLFEDNLFHCDLHPGNIMLQRDSKVALIDFGSIGSFEKSLLDKYHMMIRALAVSNYVKVADVFMLMTTAIPDVELGDVKSECVRMLRDWKTRASIKKMPYHEKSLTNALGRLARIFTTAGLPSSWEFMRLHRAELTLDASLTFLVPQINYFKLVREYEEERLERAMRTAMKPGVVRGQVARLLSVIDLPEAIAENLYFDGEWMRRRAMSVQGGISKAARIAASFLRLLATIALVAAAFALVVNAHRLWKRLVEGDTLGLDKLLESAPYYNSPWFWVGGFVGSLLIWRSVLRFHRVLSAPEPNHPGKI